MLVKTKNSFSLQLSAFSLRCQKLAIARLIHPAECLHSVVRGAIVADCAIDLTGVDSAGTGCANGKKITRMVNWLWRMREGG
ncbi:MAG: hypothetical protein LH628_02645 [Microcoleus sp. CAN_BIN18]|nr:hypothetical protein [Microcoleus sp. CAN_BIN18]